jgi:hypothetical protein
VNERRNWFSLAFLLAVVLAGCTSASETSTPLPSELSIEEHALTQRPEAEYTQLYFSEGTQAEILAVHAGERSQIITIMDHACDVDGNFGQCSALGTDSLAAWLDYTSGPSSTGTVTLTSNGEPIYQIPVGDSSPIGSLRGLWVYDQHWALETAYVTTRQVGNEIDSQATGQISIDGQLLNEQLGYQEAFGFQTMHGKPFYFFERDNEIGVSYDSVEIPLGYTEVLHYGCCSAASLNPLTTPNMVAFFARKGSTWYYVEIGVFGQASS